ncbi:hypothetical protein [Litoribacillus peritrichatus]|uniref:Uncharacterized protein n=1 Tax=Litoribacillus peritrichatus TaxID=718191 RepID=A0ABP7M2F3_9GAMM
MTIDYSGFKREEYLKFIKEDIFKVGRVQSFNLLFDLIENLKDYPSIALLERSYIYNGYSIFSPLFSKTVEVIDYRPETANERSGFQKSWVDDYCRYMVRSESSVVIESDEPKFEGQIIESDLLLVPNVLHHCSDFEKTLTEIIQYSNAINKIAVFDSYIREEHQAPDDYARQTRWSLKRMMQSMGFSETQYQEAGNVFDAIRYMIFQADKLLSSEPELGDVKKSLYQLDDMLVDHCKNEEYRSLRRPHASLSTGYWAIYER